MGKINTAQAHKQPIHEQVQHKLKLQWPINNSGSTVLISLQNYIWVLITQYLRSVCASWENTFTKFD